MIYLEPTSFAIGVLTGVIGTIIFASFAAALVTFAGADADKRGLSGRHRPGALYGGELPAHPFAATVTVAPQKDPTRPGSSTAARVSSHPRPRPIKASSRSRPEGPRAKHKLPERPGH